MDLLTASLAEMTAAVRSKKVSASELAQGFLNRIDKHNPLLNAFITVNSAVVEEARTLDQKISKGEDPGLLAGVPFGIKDMLCTRGLRTTAASKILENFIPPYDATVVAKLKKAGAVVLGKLNQDEFAMGSSNETSYFGPVRNPWNPSYVPGGSSGGSAAAQAGRLAAATIGTDTGGSIRQPANFCGVVGLKPTYGRVSRYGIVAYASSLDQAGPMVSTVEDAALILEVISGYDPKDGTTSSEPVPQYQKALKKDLKGLRVGLPKEYFLKDGLDSDVEKTIQTAIETVKALGAECVEVSLPLTPHAVPVYYLVAASEASSNLSRYDGVKYGHRAEFSSLAKVSLDDFYSQTRGEGFGSEVKRRIMLGTYCLSSGYYEAYYNKACQVRRLLRQEFVEAFQKCDVLLSPVTTSPAFKLGERISDPLSMYLNDILTVSANLAGLPGMSVPFGEASSGLPIGVQLMAGHFQEEKLLQVGYALEQSRSRKARVPFE